MVLHMLMKVVISLFPLKFVRFFPKCVLEAVIAGQVYLEDLCIVDDFSLLSEAI